MKRDCRALHAREKAGKSTLVGHACAAVSKGGDFLGQPVEPGIVLYFGFDEHIGDLARRLVEAGAAPDRVLIVENLPTTLMELREIVEAVRPSLTVIDALSSMAARNGWLNDENDAAKCAPIMRELTDIARDTNTAVLLLHHATKGQNGTYRGSTAIAAAADMVISMRTGNDIEPLSDEDDGIRVLTAKGRLPAEHFSVRYEGGTFALEDATLSLEQRIIRAIELEPGLSANAIVERVGGRRRDGLEAIRRLLGNQRIEDRRSAKAGALYIAKLSTSASGRASGSAPAPADVQPRQSCGEFDGSGSAPAPAVGTAPAATDHKCAENPPPAADCAERGADAP